MRELSTSGRGAPKPSGLSATSSCGCEKSLGPSEAPRSQEKQVGELRLAQRSRGRSAESLARGSFPAASAQEMGPSGPFGRGRWEGLELARETPVLRLRGEEN